MLDLAITHPLRPALAMGAGSHAEFGHYLSITYAGFGHYLSITSLLLRPALAMGAGSLAAFDHYVTITCARLLGVRCLLAMRGHQRSVPLPAMRRRC